MPYADLKGGFLSDSLRESPQEIGIADRPEADIKIGPVEVLISNPIFVLKEKIS
jgi:hypothetical protein